MKNSRLIIGIIGYVLVIANVILKLFGVTYFENVTLESWVMIATGVVTIIAFIRAWWKNHDVTNAAKKAGEVLTAYKEGKADFVKMYKNGEEVIHEFVSDGNNEKE